MLTSIKIEGTAAHLLPFSIIGHVEGHSKLTSTLALGADVGKKLGRLCKYLPPAHFADGLAAQVSILSVNCPLLTLQHFCLISDMHVAALSVSSLYVPHPEKP
jgi:hypothetical protein